MADVSDLKSCRDREKYWLGSKTLDLYVRSTGEYILLAPDREQRKIQNDFGEIFWPISGECIFHYNEKTYTLSVGNVWYYPPGSLHDFYPPEKFHYCWLSIAGSEAAKLFDLMQLKPGLNKADICPRNLFRAICNELDFSTMQNGANALATAVKILSMIKIMPHPDSQTNKTILSIKDKIDVDLDNPGLNVERLADEIGMHRGSLSRAFKKNFGITISDYIISQRLRKATELLSSSSLSIQKIAAQCGITSAHYFSKVFSEKIGVSPSEFRRRKMQQ